MKIVIATGIFIPDIGGPATYSPKVAEKFVAQGHDVSVITYSNQAKYDFDDSLGYPVFRVKRSDKLRNYFNYFKVLKKMAKSADIVYAHDLISVGLPCALFKLFNPKVKMVVRLGGDFLWEKAYNSGWTKEVLSNYHGQSKNAQEKVYLGIYKFALAKFDQIIFSTKWQQDIYAKYFPGTKDKSVVIANAYPEDFQAGEENDNGKILFAGRLIKLKNLGRLIEAVKDTDKELVIIGDGPEKERLINLVKKLGLENRIRFKDRMPAEQLAKEISQSHFTIVPSISEISPNTVLESIKLNKPVLLTKESGFYSDFKDRLIFIDPMDIDDIKNKIADMFDENKYNNYLSVIESINLDRGWQEVSVDHLDLFKKLLS